MLNIEAMFGKFIGEFFFLEGWMGVKKNATKILMTKFFT